MNINALPNDCLIIILNSCNLSLPQLIALRAVCSQWNQIIRTMCRSRRSLKLFGTVYGFLWSHSTLMKLQHEEEEADVADDDGRLVSQKRNMLSDVIQWRGPAEEAENFLPELFPNLQKLFFCCTGTQLQLPSLLANWPNQLTCLTLWGDPSSPEDWIQLWRSIHTQHSSLRKLYLMDFEYLDIPEECQALNWWHQIAVKGHHTYQLDILLSRLGQNCKTVQLEQTKVTEITLMNMINREQCRFITSLTICEIDELTKKKTKNYLNIICENFKELKHFYPKFASEHLQLDEIQNELAKLPQLTSLRLHLNNLRLGIATLNPWLAKPKQLHTFPSQPPMTSIQSLTFDNYKFRPFLIKKKHLDLLEVIGKLFSEVKELTIWYRVQVDDQVVKVKNDLKEKLKKRLVLERLEKWKVLADFDSLN